MNIEDFNFDLPESLVGQKAIEPRDSCRLLVLDKDKGGVSHHVFSDLKNILDENCVLVLNDTKVFPARLFGKKETGGQAELLLLKQTGQSTFSAIGKGLPKKGSLLTFGRELTGTVEEKHEDGEVEINFNYSGPELLEKIDQLGSTPLPPYVHSKEKEPLLREQYQTVYARERGSSAAPTAGLHFTDKLLADLMNRGVMIEKVTLHVGLGTFRPVTTEQIRDKVLHSESFFLSQETAQRLNLAKKAGKKIIAVGTTACRLLETLSNEQGMISPGAGETNIFIQPGYKFKFVDGLITNFHLPKTSLLMLVSALVSAPNSPTAFKNFSDSPIGKAYREAIKKEYKFFSFGDAMLIL
ncbi:MAG: S-adenosylmethionine:tRNA ribosyltransferase-isomerase [Candidatus Nomurabacteria bacterium GW2011_GWF1_31_48]|uniref:S-adenosylmethionine:tRNA ribosyltransferase-isomerase n=1 Tax=Candidatus Nomurabacteria bacterium GW2011_GWF1_31_48 TaxID=1618767 RepID=A0A0G0BDX0_9BACT|nr:MAG: S-adenosylmethionine:tRNA ribosyltransferase-isomerase [Candidatus Nomurabacteria bacterium GW2011_GWF1_31_48]